MIRDLFEKGAKVSLFTRPRRFGKTLARTILKTFFEHGYLVGLLGSLEGYSVDSNKEKGNGRPDLVLSPFTPKETAVIIEIKRVDKFSQMEDSR